MTKMRIEKDSLGNIKVPADALYGAQTQRAIENFDYSERTMPEIFIISLAQIKKAAARANKELKSIDSAIADFIVLSCDKVLADEMIRQTQFPVCVFQTGSGTSTNMNMNEVLASLANRISEKNAEENRSTENNKDEYRQRIHPNDHVNFGQSSNDVIPSAVQLSALCSIVEKLFPAIGLADKRLSALSEQYAKVLKTGRTHLMDAMPMTLGDEIETWRYQILEGKERIASSLARLAAIPLGGTAIGTGINRHKDFPQQAIKFLSEQTHLPITSCANLASRMGAQDPVLELHGQLKVLATTLMKLANDLRWMNSGPNSGLSELQLKPLQPGSSIMPGKVNPVIAESVAMMCAEVMGNDTTLTIANQSGNFQLNVMLPLIADTTLRSIDLLSQALTALAQKAWVDITIHKDRLSKGIMQNPVLATALNTKIGYEKAAEIAKRAQNEGRSVIEVALELTDISEVELKELLNPMKLARPFD